MRDDLRHFHVELLLLLLVSLALTTAAAACVGIDAGVRNRGRFAAGRRRAVFVSSVSLLDCSLLLHGVLRVILGLVLHLACRVDLHATDDQKRRDPEDVRMWASAYVSYCWRSFRSLFAVDACRRRIADLLGLAVDHDLDVLPVRFDLAPETVVGGSAGDRLEVPHPRHRDDIHRGRRHLAPPTRYWLVG